MTPFYESFGYLEGTIQLAHERCALGDATKRGSDDALRAIRAEHEFMERLLRVTEAAENNEDLLWREQADGSWKFFVICNDIFWWATADLEEITPDNIHILEESYKDLNAIDYVETSFTSMLFAARARGMRPQRPAYPRDDKVAMLFDAVGPPREWADGG